MAGYICPVRQSQFSQSNDRSWSLAKYTKLLGEKEEVLTAESRLCVVINTSLRYLSVLSGSTTIEEMSLISIPAPVIKTRDHDVFFRLTSHNGNVVAKFRIKFLSVLDRCAFTALLSNYVELVQTDGVVRDNIRRCGSQPFSQNDSGILAHSQTCSQSSTSSYVSKQSLHQSQSSQSTYCSQNNTQGSLLPSTFSSQSFSQPMSTVSQSTAFSQPLGMFSQSSSALAQLPTTKLPFKSASFLGESRKQNTDGILYSSQPSTLYENTKGASLSYEGGGARLSQQTQDVASADGRSVSASSFQSAFHLPRSGAKGQSNAHDCSGQLSQQQARGAGLNSCLSSTTSFEISSEALSKENSRLGGEDYADFSQPKSCSLNSSSYLASETFDTEDEFLDHSFLGKTPPGNDQIVPTVDTVQANVSDDFALNEIVPRTETVEKEQTDDEIGGTQPIVASKADAATQTDRMVTVQDLLADDELLKRLIVARLKDPVYIAFQKKFSSALLRQPAGKRKIARARARSSAFDKK